MFKHDSRGIDPDMKYRLLPEGKWFPFRIHEAEEQTSKSGRDMILAKCRVIGDERYADMEVWHFVVFMKKGEKGDGISVHFRRCIGVPFGGQDMVDATDWVGLKFMGKIAHEVYNGKKNHKIAEVSPMPTDGSVPSEAEPPAAVGAAVTSDDDTIPF